MKKMLSIILSVMLLFVFSACKSDDKATGDLTPSTASQTSKEISLDNAEDMALQSTKSEGYFQSGSNVSTPTKPQTAEEALQKMSLAEKAAQLFIVHPEQLLNEKRVTAFSGESLRYDVGGVILFDANIVNRSQCIGLISALQNASKTPLFIAVDEEGGRVARVANNKNMGTTVFSSMSKIVIPEEAYNVGKTIGKDIKQLGFNLNFAPVADVNSNPENPIINDRSFGSDPNTVATLVENAVKGFDDSKMLCTLKHFPGHGDTETDSHLGYTEVNKTLNELKKTEFVPFKAGIDANADFVMMGHIALPKVTGNNLPATLSSEIISILRNDLNFKGIVITDSMSMKAITNTYASDKAAVMALKAGNDMILIPSDLDTAISGIISAVKGGEISEGRLNESVLKILKLKYSSGIVK